MKTTAPVLLVCCICKRAIVASHHASGSPLAPAPHHSHGICLDCAPAYCRELGLDAAATARVLAAGQPEADFIIHPS